jgi:hypothetical protein
VSRSCATVERPQAQACRWMREQINSDHRTLQVGSVKVGARSGLRREPNVNARRAAGCSERISTETRGSLPTRDVGGAKEGRLTLTPHCEAQLQIAGICHSPRTTTRVICAPTTRFVVRVKLSDRRASGSLQPRPGVPARALAASLFVAPLHS